MGKVILAVPTEAQAKTDTCWHASAFMIWRYWQWVTGRQGPMNTLSKNWEDNHPITPQQFVALAQKVGLHKVPPVPSYRNEDLTRLLQQYGPLWCAGFWFGLGHVIVLTGVDGDIIFFNDPDGGVKKDNTVAWFNTKLAKTVDGCIMSKDPTRY